MAYVSSVAAVRKILDAGLYSGFGTAAELSKGGGNIWLYASSHASSDCGAVTGFFAGCGRQPTSGVSPASANLARSANNVGMGAGDLVCVQQTSNGTNVGAVTWHCVKGSTFNQSSTSLSSAFSN